MTVKDILHIKIRKVHDFGTYFSIDHVQGDPFASPSKLSIHVKGRSAGFPASFYDTKYKQVALCDHLTRLFLSNF